MLDADSEQRFVELTHRLAAQNLAFFIGAGLSIPCGKPGWRQFLVSRAPNEAVRTHLEALLDKDGYEEAATDLLDALGESAFDEAFRIAFGPFDADAGQPKGPIRLVPKLLAFSRCAVVATTNFDRNLEAACRWESLASHECVRGGDQDRLRDCYETGRRALWKPHGEYLSPTHRVLTRAEYQRAYGGRTAREIDYELALPRSLLDYFTRHSVLFLGCSLGPDRTLAILERVHREFPARHFAILEDTGNGSRAKRDQWLLDRSIHAIWYEQGAHHRVTELLNRLHVAVTGSRAHPFRPQWSERAACNGHGQSWLERDKLCDEDFQTHDAVPPPQLERALEALARGHIVISGSPGSGKSAFAVWVERELVARGISSFVWLAEHSHAATLCERVRALPSGFVGILDDAHLMAEEVASLLDDDCAIKHRFLILGRPGVFETGVLEPKVRALEHFSLDADIANVARTMALHHAAADVDALLKVAGDDLVLMKMLLLARSAAPKPEISRDAVLKYMQLRLGRMWDRSGPEFVRLYLVLGCFRILELPCSLQALRAQLGFDHQVIRLIVEREQLAVCIDGKILLTEHARRAELYLIAVNGMSLINSAVLDTTLGHVGTADVCLQGTQLWSLVLAVVFGRIVVFGKGVGPGRGDLKTPDIVDRLLYGAHSGSRPYGGIDTDWRGLAGIAAELELSHSGTLDEATEERRLELACAIANGLRRRRGGEVARSTLVELRSRLGVTEMPARSFERKGNILYQLAYVAWMSNELPLAIELFEQSAVASEIYAQQVVADAARCALHRAKAVMSRIACARMRAETFVTHALGGTCAPAECLLPAESLEHSNDLIDQLRACQPLIDDVGRREFERFLLNGLFHVGQTLAWLGRRDAALRAESEANEIGQRLGTSATHSSRLLRGQLAFAEGCFEQVLQELQDTALIMIEKKSGETSGLRALLCAQAAWRLGDLERYGYWCEWLAEVCPREAGNAPAVDWARQQRLHSTGS